MRNKSRRAPRPANALGLLALLGLYLPAPPAFPAAPDSPVADAAMRGDVDTVRSLLQHGADVNAAQGDGMTALHWAARNGSTAMTSMLIYAGANIEAATRLGDYTALHLASQAGHADVLVALLGAGASLEAATSTGGARALHFAAAAGKATAVEALLERGAEVDAREESWMQTPLMFAAAGGRVAAVRALLHGGADPSITAATVDISTREQVDRTAQRERTRRVEALAATTEERGPPGQASPGQQTGRPASIPRTASGEPELRGTTEIDPLSYADLVGSHGGLTALLLAARDGHATTVQALLDGGADINQVSAGDHSSPLLIATINGHFDLALHLLELGADPTLASDAGATPLYGALNMEWVPKSRHPQPTDYQQQQVTYIELMRAFLDTGADVNARLSKPLWYTTYNNDLLRVERTGATPFWRAAYALDVEAMRLLIAHGANPDMPTIKTPQRRFGPRRNTPDGPDPSGLPPAPIGGPAVYPIHAATGVGYGEGFAANSHRHVPDGWLPAVTYLVEELGVDVNVRDHNGYNAVHHAAARGDNELILYLVEHGADVTPVSRRGQTTVDMANGPVQRIQPFPETIVLLESLGAVNNHNCVSC